MVQMSKGVALMNCRSDWRWADFNDTQPSWRQAFHQIVLMARPRGDRAAHPSTGGHVPREASRLLTAGAHHRVRTPRAQRA